MGNSSSSSASPDGGGLGGTRSVSLAGIGDSPAPSAKGKKICCVCKDTKSARDECVIRNGEERCHAFIDAHNRCLRAEGFDVTSDISSQPSSCA